MLDVRFRIPPVRTIRRWAVVGAALLAVVVGSPVAAAASYVPITGAGSTWSSTAINAWTSSVAQFGMTVGHAAVGSTTGRDQFRTGAVDWAASDDPYGLVDGTNVDRVTNLRLSGPVIAGIFTGTITTWNDPAIAEDNPGLSLPAIRIVPVVRSDGAGSTAQFTQWLVATRADWTAYCQRVGRSPCTQTSTYPVLPGSGMVGQGSATLTVGDLPLGSNPITATFVPTDPTAFAASTSAPVAVVIVVTQPGPNDETIQVGLGAVSSGSLTLTVSGTPVTIAACPASPAGTRPVRSATSPAAPTASAATRRVGRPRSPLPTRRTT